MEHNEEKLVVLIDADNVTHKALNEIFQEIAKLGDVAVKRIYGDFTSPNNARWKEMLNEYAIKPVAQFAYTTGKNASDSALIIDAMDLLHTGRFDGFCIVSSDSDFTGLAMRIKEDGLKVYGFGERKTPKAFIKACNKFTFVDLLQNDITSPLPEEKKTDLNTKSQKEPKKTTYVSLTDTEEIPYDLLKKAIENSCNESGFALLSLVGTNILRIMPEFDPRRYKKGNAPFAKIFRERPDMFKISGSGGKLSVKIKS